MKESNVEGVANRNGLKLCGGSGDTAAEALAEVSAGTVLSPEIGTHVPDADRLFAPGRQYVAHRRRQGVRRLAGSEARGMRGNSLGGNRETLQPPLRYCGEGRTANSKEERL